MRARTFLLACALVAHGCDVVPAQLPESPKGGAPAVRGFSPAAAFADEVVTLELDGTVPTARLEVRFGTSGPVVARHDDDGWRATVPLDATTGPLTVVNEAGATAAGAFTYRGAGHVRDGRVTRRRSIAPALVDAVTSPQRGGSFLLVREPVPAVQIDASGMITTHGAVSSVSPAALALTPAGDVLVVAGADLSDACRTDTGTPGLAAVVLALAPEDAAHSLGVELARLCVHVDADTREVARIATNPDATQLLVSTLDVDESGPDALHLVDVASGNVITFTGDGELPLDGPSWAGDGAFIARDGDALRRIVVGAPPEEWPRAEVPLDPDPAWMERVRSVAAHPSGLIAVGTTTGRTYLSQAGWPPVFEQHLDDVVVQRSPGDFGTDVVDLAFSRSGDELLLVQDYYARAVLHRRAGNEWPLVSATTLPAPNRVSPAANGAFVVTTADGARLLSGTTAAVMTPLLSGTLPRALRLGACPSGEPVLLTGSGSFSLAFRLDPVTLEDAQCGPLVFEPPTDDASLEEVEGGAGGTLFTRWDDATLLRLRPPDGREPVSDAVGPADSISERRLRVLAGGAVLATFDPRTKKLVLRDAEADAFATGRTRTVTLPDGFIDAYDLGDEIVGLGETELVAVPRATMFDGTDDGRRLAISNTPLLAAAAGDHLVTVSGAEEELHCTLTAIAPADGTETAAGAFPCPGRVHWMELSPDRRRLYLLGEDATGSRSVLRLVYDPVARHLLGTERPIHLQAGTDSASYRVLATSAEGDRLYALDTYADGVVAIE